MSRENEMYVLSLIAKDVCQNYDFNNHKAHMTGMTIRGNILYELNFVTFDYDNNVNQKRTICLPAGIIGTMSPTKIRHLLITELY